MTADLTPALRLAARLQALAAHLTRHPHLAPVNVIYDELQVQYGVGIGMALLAWADTLTDVTVRVQGIQALAYVEVTGTATVGTVIVWSIVPGFLNVLGMAADAPWSPIELDSLRTFVTADQPASGEGGA